MNHIRVGCVSSSVNFCKNLNNFSVDHWYGLKPGLDFEVFLELLQFIRKFYDAKLSTSLHVYESYGVGNGTGLVKGLKDGEIDIAIHTLAMNIIRYQVINYLDPAVLYDERSFIVNPAPNYQKPPSLFEVFDQTTWILLLISIVIVSFMLTLISSFDKQRSGQLLFNPSSLFDTFFGVVYDSAAQDTKSHSQNMFLVFLWGMCSLFMTSLFSAIFVMGLTPELKTIPFTNFQELGELLKKREYRFIVSGSGIQMTWLNDANFAAWKPIRDAVPFNEIIVVKNSQKALEKLQMTSATVFPSNPLQAATAMRKNPFLLKIEDHASPPTLESIGTKPNFSMENEFREGYFALNQHGIIKHLSKTYGIDEDATHYVEKKLEEMIVKPLQYTHIKEAFWLLIYGLGISSAVCLLEIGMHLLFSKGVNMHIM